MRRALLVTGSRTATRRTFPWSVLDAWLEWPSLVIIGDANGVDRLVFDAFGEVPWTVRSRFVADWKTHGKKAGMLRNQEMVEEALQCRAQGYDVRFLAFPIEGSRGTADCVRRCVLAGIAGEVHPIGQEE